ncbi:MAG: LysM peptidoglycan-binding domain-containing protein [Clostridiales bacterium]|nr:LysM peptidoglycan-binding domain-containing protein [Clostridiales bacterium]
MAVKIYLSASNQIHNPCKMGDSESDHCNLYLDKLEPLLKTGGFLVKRCSPGEGIREMVADSNSWGADLHLVNHTNAASGGVRGSNIFISGKWEETKKLAETMANHRRKVYPYGVSIRTSNSWYEMNAVNAYCVYEELVFHDNEQDARWFHENMDLLADATAKALCEHYGKSSPAKPSPEATAEKTYTVQIGDTLTYIARRYGTTYEALAAYNGLSNPNRIYPGQKIRIPDISLEAIRTGDRVRVKSGAKTYGGGIQLADFVYRQEYEVMELWDDRAVIGRNGLVTAAVSVSDLVKA